MSVLRSQLVAEVYEYCGNPDDLPLKDKGLPQQFVFQILTESEDEMLRDLDLSTSNRRVGKWEDTITESEFGLLIDGNPSYVAVRLDPASEVWEPVEVVNHGSLIQAGIDGRLAIAFRDTPIIAEVSWVPESAQTLRILYDRSANDAPELAASTELGNLYDSFLKLRTAAQCREIMGLPVGDILKARLVDSQRQWKRFVSMSRQQGTASKTPVFTPPRLRRNRLPLDPTRFYLPR